MTGKLRDFVILHSQGASFVSAADALGALVKASCPLGFKDARGVIEGGIIMSARNANEGASFAAFFGNPIKSNGGER